jgi:hypothetical protein
MATNDNMARVCIIPCGLNYFRGHRFRSRCVVEFGASEGLSRTRAHAHALARTRARARTRTNTHAHMQASTRARACTPARMHTRTHARTHVRTHAHMHAHTHAVPNSLGLPPSWCAQALGAWLLAVLAVTH